MKIGKFLALAVGFSALLTLTLSLFAFTGTKPSLAAKPIDNCRYVVDGNIPYPTGHFLDEDYYTTGYDVFGYNYQAHIFNGSYANAYLGRSGLAPYTGDDASYLVGNPGADSHWTWPFRNVQLQMKWNDAWLANKDCNEYGALDRPNPYIGSGAWLTNHATGTYTGSKWDVTGSYVLSFNYLESLYVHDMTVTATDGTFTGTGGYPSGSPYGITWVVDGTVTGDTIAFHVAYDGSSYYVDASGTIAPNGTMSGTWSNASQSGTWTATTGTAVHPTCTVSDFVKIVAVPASAFRDPSIPDFYGEGMWYEYAGGPEIGPVLWGEFAVIQEIASDPCGEYGVIDYMSPLRKGLGNW